MNSRTKILLPVIILLALAGFSCLPNPSAPTLDPPGEELLYFANYGSIQMCGDFQTGYEWSPGDARSNMTLVADYAWRISVAIRAEQTTDNQIVFKFAQENDWSNHDSFGHGGTLGQAVLQNNADNIELPFSGGDGFYIFEFDDETLRYTTEPVAETGALSGTVLWDGAAPAEPATVECWVRHASGNIEIWGAEATGDAFEIGALADSLYRVRISAPGFASVTVDDVRVSDGGAVLDPVTLSQVFGAISGTVTFSDDPDPLPETVVVLSTHADQVEVARVTTSTASGAYLFEGLNYDDYDIAFSAVGYEGGLIENLRVDSDVVNDGNDIELQKIAAAIPDEPYFTATIDGAIDGGWTANVTDPAGDSDWGGSVNDLTGLYVSWDATNLYVGVSGGFESSNTVNVYIDKDFGEGTGVTDFTTIGGSSAGDHLRKNIDASGIAGFGADFAGSVWGTQYDPEVTDLTDPAAVTPLTGGTLLGSTSAMEFSVPWTSLYPEMGGGIPGHTELAFFCVIGGGGDDYLCGDTIPAVDDVRAPDAVFTIQVDTDNR